VKAVVNTTLSGAWRGVLQSPRPLSARGTAALEYAAWNWEVFPAPPGQKKSHKSQEHSGAKWGKTIDPEEIRADFHKWPNANVAIVTGATSGIFVLEADTVEGHGVDGLASIKALEAEHGSLPETLKAVSPTGSEHYYFNHPGHGVKIKNSVSAIAPGVDVRGDGGMVIAPPSVKPGVGEYRWLNHLPVADAPAWLIEAASKQNEAKKPSSRAPAGEKAAADQNFEHRHRHKADADLEEIEAALMAIPNDASGNWTQWNRVGMALFAATDGSAAGFAMFDRWSEKYPGYDSDDTAAKWGALEKCPPTEIGAGTVFYLADQASATWRSDYRLASIGSNTIRLDDDESDNVDLIEQVVDIFDDAQSLRGSLAEKYLNGLGLTVPDGAHEVLRFHRSYPFGEFNLPCLVAYVQDSLTNEPAGVHLTALSPEATPIDRKIVGSIDCYSTIKLGGDSGASGELTIAASIEAALSAMMFGFTPAWAVLSVDGIGSHVITISSG
jgi:bifunctional DNA primase/polymerase-like protein/primase-like protein